MSVLSPLRRLLKLFHPEGIPWPGTVFYNLISGTTIFQRSYEVIARDISDYCTKGRLLDIGTGPGWLLLKLHQQAPGMRLVGIDASSSMVAKAQENIVAAGLSHVIEVSGGNASRLPLAEGSFDIVVSTGSIHHWKDPITALNEVHRVLKPGASALMYDLVSDTPASVLDGISREFGKLKTVLFWLHGFEEPFYTRQSFEELARLTLFKEGRIRFVSLLCCLTLKKQSEAAL